MNSSEVIITECGRKGMGRTGQTSAANYFVRRCSPTPTAVQKGVTRRKENSNPWANFRLAASLAVQVASLEW
jgi:hypothetical protein